MEDTERQLILRAVESDQQIRRLYDEHLRLERLLEGYSSRLYLTPEEEMEEKELKIKKLRGKDLMMQLISGSSCSMSA